MLWREGNTRMLAQYASAKESGRLPDAGPTVRRAATGAHPPSAAAGLQRTVGNQAVLRMLSNAAPAIQPKLTVNEPGDSYEQEADRVADRVMHMADPASEPPPAAAGGAAAVIRRKCAACEEEEKQGNLKR